MIVTKVFAIQISYHHSLRLSFQEMIWVIVHYHHYHYYHYHYHYHYGSGSDYHHTPEVDSISAFDSRF